MEPHGRIPLKLRVERLGYDAVGAEFPDKAWTTVVSALCDSGAQMCVTGVETGR